MSQTRAELRASGACPPTHQRRRTRLARVADANRLTAEIELVSAAQLRLSAAVDAMCDRWYREDRGGCCPACWGGASYHQISEQATRTSLHLAVLLRKRGTAGDIERATVLEQDWQ